MGKGHDEFEITEAMLDKAADALIWLDANDGNPRGIVRAMLVAMGAVETPQRLFFRKDRAPEPVDQN
jgi:hypothetical protein